MPRRYRYVGPEEIKNALLAGGRRSLITTAQDVLQWIDNTGQRGEGGLVVATYIIDTQEMLWIADAIQSTWFALKGRRFWLQVR